MNAEATKRKTLGRGLNALFGEQDESDAVQSAVSNKSLMTVAIDLLAPSPLQPRHHFDDTAIDELAASIREKGVLQPLLVRAAQTPGHYEIIAGERRWRAAQRAQVHEVPVIVRELDDAQVLEVALIENLQRRDLSPAEEARGYQRLVDEFDHTQEQIGEIVGKSRAHVANTLRLLTLPETILAMLEDGRLTAGQARPLIGARDAATLADKIVREGLSARQVERLVKTDGGKPKRASHGTATAPDADTRALEQSLEKATGYKIHIKFDGHGGSVNVGYANLDQLDDIVRRLSSGGRKGKATAAPGFSVGTRFQESRETSARDDHDAPYPDPSADSVGASGSLAREPRSAHEDIPADFGIGARMDETHRDDAGWHEDHSLEPAESDAHPDPGASDVGADGATHR